VASNATVEADVVTRDTVEVIAEETEAGMELLEDDGLGLNLADLLEDDPLGHLLEDNETLLDDLDGLGVADDLGLLLYDLGEVDGAVEVVRTIEVIEVIEGREATPVVEGDVVGAGEDLPADGDGFSESASDEGRGDKDSRSELGEHVE